MELFMRTAMRDISAVRPSPIAGSWYPGKPDALLATVQTYLKRVKAPQIKEPVVGLIAPHAGYFYSGPTAAYAYSGVQGQKFDICAVFSPLHDYQPFDLLTSAHKAYATPLGEVPIDEETVSIIQSGLQHNNLPALQHIAYDREHSLEIQLPFLQVALAAPFKLLPIMVRTHNATILQAAATVIAAALSGKRVLVVASTDLSHFYPLNTANSLDQHMTAHFEHFDPQGVLDAEAHQEGFACGAGAVALALWVTQAMGAKTVTLLHHTTSAEASGDASSVVGYAAAAITG
jgi:AmmeMemoRadiSam system protein B